MRAFKTPLIIITILIVVALVAYWDEQKAGEEKAMKGQKNRIFSFEEDDISKLVIKRRATPNPIELERVGGKWYIMSPIQEMADQRVVADYVKNLTSYRYDRIVSSDFARLEEFGLDSPEMQLQIEINGETKFFNIGHKAPVGYGVYVRTRGDNVYLGSQFIMMALNKDLFALRNKKVFSIDLHELKRIELVNKFSEKMIFSRNSNSWIMAQPDYIKLDQGIFNTYISELNRLMATGFPDDSASKKERMDRSCRRVTSILLASDNEMLIDICQYNGEYYVYENGRARYILDKSYEKYFQRRMVDFQSKNH